MIYAISEIKKGRVPVIELVILIALSIVLFSSINTYFGAGVLAKKSRSTIDLHTEVTRFVKSSFNSCKKGGTDITGWGADCKGIWSSKDLINHINNKLGYKNPFNLEYGMLVDVKNVKTTADGQFNKTGMDSIGFIFMTKSSIRYKEKNRKRATWDFMACHKTPCMSGGHIVTSRAVRER